MAEIQENSAYNSKSRWAEAGIFKRPLFDVASFQRQVDGIVGLSPSGHSIVRVSWAWDVRKWENTAWDAFGNATAGEWRQKYRALSVDIGGDDFVDISPPRWILEERFEPESIAESWERTRYRKITTGQPHFACPNCHAIRWISSQDSEADMAACRFCPYVQVLATVSQDVWGPVPREGWYNLLPKGIIADHRNGCCKKSWEGSREICYGEYRLPGNLDLKRLRRAVRLRDREVATNPHVKPELNEVALQQAKAWGLQMMSDARVRKQTELAEISRANRPNNNIVYGGAI